MIKWHSAVNLPIEFKLVDPPKLGELRCKVFSYNKDYMILIWYNNSGKPTNYALVDRPEGWSDE